MTEQEETDRLISRITETLSHDPRFPRLGLLERDVMFRDLRRELDEAFERIFEAGYQEGMLAAESEEENADHLG
jgi:hypothetical protein